MGRAASKGQKRAGPAMDAPGLTVGDGASPSKEPGSQENGRRHPDTEG